MSTIEVEDTATDRRRSLLAGFLIGVAIMAAVDEIVYHQLLGWHHFYDRSTLDVGLLADGLLQASYLVFLVAGFFVFADLRRDRALSRRSAWAAFLIGLGAFQVFDGLFDHKVLRLHQIRYNVDDLLVYDLAWNSAGFAFLAAGAVLLWRTRAGGKARSDPAQPT